MNFCHFALPLEKNFGYAWNNRLFAPPGEIPSEAHESDCIKARNHTLLDFLHLSRKRYIFFTITFQQ